MKKLTDISIGVWVSFSIIIVFSVSYAQKNTQTTDLELVDLDGDGVISKYEVKQLFKKLVIEKKKNVEVKSLLGSMATGAFRGCLMGLLLNGVEGAVTGAIVLATVNPIVSMLEHTI